MTDVTDPAQLNTDADDQTTLIVVSAAVGAGLVAAGLAGLAAITYYWLVKRKQHGLFFVFVLFGVFSQYMIQSQSHSVSQHGKCYSM